VSRPADIIIPSCKPREALEPLIAEIVATAAGWPSIITTCLPACAAANRNRGLDLAETPNVIMVDDDVTGFPPGWNLALEAPLRARPEAVMVGANLINADGTPAPMLGWPAGRETDEVLVVKNRELCTACVCMRETGLRYDEAYEGSGWEDTDFSAQLRCAFPNGVWLCHAGVRVVHRNEKKNQGGEIFKRNHARYRAKWGRET